VSYQPEFRITPALLARVEAIAAVRERIQGATVHGNVDSSAAKGHPRSQRATLPRRSRAIR